MSKKYYSFKQTAEILGICRASIYNMVADGRLKEPERFPLGRCGFEQSYIDKLAKNK